MNLDRAIYDTIRYYALFDMPLTSVHIWRTLIVVNYPQANIDHVRYADVVHVLKESPWLVARIASQWGYYFLADQSGSVERHLQRYVLAQHKWLLTTRTARFLALAPFVRALFGSGSLALHTTRPESDLDVFVIAKQGRIWTARLGLLIISQLLGRRRKHWDRLAPDKICLNHYITDQAMNMPQAVRNLFTAVAYTRLVPVFAHAALAAFQQANAEWIKKSVASPVTPNLHNRYEIKGVKYLYFLKDQMERVLLEPIGDWIENKAKTLQLKVIAKHTHPGQVGRIVATDRELAFHPDTRVPALLERFKTVEG